MRNRLQKYVSKPPLWLRLSYFCLPGVEAKYLKARSLMCYPAHVDSPLCQTSVYNSC
jgi:hypothetical protein